jgi:hypothetical protein
VIFESLGPDVLMSPDLAKTLWVLLRAATAEVTDRYRLQIHVNGVVGRVEILSPTIPFLAVLLVAVAASGSFSQEPKRRVFTHNDIRPTASASVYSFSPPHANKMARQPPPLRG